MTLSSQLSERVAIERPVSTDDGYGGKTIIWETLATVFADVKPVYNAINERLVAEQVNANAGYRIIIRARIDITAAMRLIWKTRTLLIHSLHEVGETLNILSYEEHV